MDKANHSSHEHVIQSWYAYAATQPGSVGSWLRLLQERLGQSAAQQQREFGTTDDQFLRLVGMRLPRPDHFTGDAQRIALACELSNPFAFTKAMLLARSIDNANTNASLTNIPRQAAEHQEQYYMAAFDAQEDLDQLSEADANDSASADPQDKSTEPESR